MATAHEWIAYDIAAQKVLGEMIGQCGYSYRQFAELSNGSMSYNRVRDIELGRRAPVKLSEFLLICDVCNADPVQTLRDIIAEAQRIEARERLKTTPVESRPPTVSDGVVGRGGGDPVAEEEERKRALVLAKLHRGDVHLAAYEDPHKLDPDIDE